ncbi:MAG: amidohydrolase, partial [Gemmatimonadota bacterium]
RAALDAKWPAIVAGRPTLIKVDLLFSNEYERRRLDTTARGMKGLNPSLVPEIVRRAHAAGLRVGAHIENTSDFRVAVGAAVDLIVHMPGYGWNGAGDSTQYMLNAADAADAAQRRTAVVTTLAFGQRATAPTRTPAQRRRDALNVANLRVLKNAGVKIAIGSDNYGSTSRTEAMYLSDLGVFTNLELLKAWSETTPQLIFPGRQFAALRDGFEASFIVLDGDPLLDFGAVQRVTRRIKQEHLLP